MGQYISVEFYSCLVIDVEANINLK